MATGIVKWYNDAKGFGFAIDDETKELVLIKKENISNDPKVVFEFESVSYDTEAGEKGPVALNVVTTRKQDMSFYDHEFKTLNGEHYHMSKYSGRVTLVVNTASHCGLTPQYKELEELYQKYKLQGFSVLAFPSNNFAKQEFETNEEISTFCETQYNVTFPVFEKTNVVVADKSDLETVLPTEERPVNSFFKVLAEKTGAPPLWNFHKYLINKTGTEVLSFDIRISPLAEEIQNEIKRMLEQ